MNGAHLHLMLNHFPLTGFVFSLIVLSLGFLRRNDAFVSTGLIIIVLSGALALPTYFSGDPAEDVIKNSAVFSESRVEAHEEAAEFAIWLIEVTALSAAFSYFALLKKRNFAKKALAVTFALNVVALGAIARVNNLGGQISHPEIRDGAN
jgi:uncharacterized membrane protein